MAKAVKSRKPAPRPKRAALSGEPSVAVEPGDILVSLDEESNFLFLAKTQEFRAISQIERNEVTQHYADAAMATKKRPIVVPLACRRMEEYALSKATRRRPR